MYSGAEMCSEPNRKYARPEINKRKIQIQELGNEKNFQTHISDRFVSLVHHLHQLLRSVIKDVLNVFVSGGKTLKNMRLINLNKAHVFLPERHLAVCWCL